MPDRKPLSVRTRFEVFKRDNFTCRYCGRTTPECVLEIDHIVPVADGGSNDAMNLATSCWECNSGKNAVPLSQCITGEDPHDKAIELLERDRQLREYNTALAKIRKRAERESKEVVAYWQTEAGWHDVSDSARRTLKSLLKTYPSEVVKLAIDQAVKYGKDSGLGYTIAVLAAWRREGRHVA